MTDKAWMIYGAYGYTGKLVAAEAVRRGHSPILAGRSASKLRPLAETLGLESKILDLQDKSALRAALRDFDLVFHAAGPYGHTSEPMLRACLASGTSYVDVAAEPLVLAETLSLGTLAEQAHIAVLPGAGFDVIATDCLSLHVARQIDQPMHLEIATAASFTAQMSPGSAKTYIDTASRGILARRQGQLVRISARQRMRRVRFADRDRLVVPATLGDLVTAQRTTGIEDITTYTTLPEKNTRGYALMEPLFRRMYAISLFRRLGHKLAERSTGPDEEMRQTDRSHVWVRVTNGDGDQKQTWLETMESYQFTAVAGVRCVEKILADRPQGALTPALAFGADFILEIPHTKRIETLQQLS